MVGERQGTTGFEGPAMRGTRPGLGEAVQPPAHVLVAGQLLGLRVNCAEKPPVPNQAPQPDVSEVYEFRVLDVAEIGWVSETASNEAGGICAPRRRRTQLHLARYPVRACR